MQRIGNSNSSFLGTLNRLSGASSVAAADPEQVKRMVLQRLQEGPANLKGLAELSLPMSAVETGLAALHDLGLVQITAGADGNIYKLSDYAAKALTYITPA